MNFTPARSGGSAAARRPAALKPIISAHSDTRFHCAVREASPSLPGLPHALSRWSASLAKRVFDIACVLCAAPIAIPAFLLIGAAVRLTSRGPVLFKQVRVGRHGQTFTIYKFRTMPVRRSQAARPNVTTAINQRFTAVGPFLRRWKLDELPQLYNVLRGEMSLVGPRPKLPSHQSHRLSCRPGITGSATLMFAREEVALASVPLGQLDSYYHGVILPLKHQLDVEYMARATFLSDLQLIWKSVLRQWQDLDLSSFPVPPPNARQEHMVLTMPRHAHHVTAIQAPVPREVPAD